MPIFLLQLGHAPIRKLNKMSRVHAVVNSSSLCFLSKCCRCYWCRVAPWAPSLFSISQQKQHQSGRACQNLKKFGTNDWRTTTPQIAVECRDSDEAVGFWAKDVGSALRLCVTLAPHDVLLGLLHSVRASDAQLSCSSWATLKFASWDEMSRVHAVVNSSSLCFLSRCCRCYWCRVAPWAPSLFSISQQKQHQSGRACQNLKRLGTNDWRTATPRRWV